MAPLQAQLREPRKWGFFPVCVAGEDNSWPPELKVFISLKRCDLGILLLPPSKETSVSSAFTVAVKCLSFFRGCLLRNKN